MKFSNNLRVEPRARAICIFFLRGALIVVSDIQAVVRQESCTMLPIWVSLVFRSPRLWSVVYLHTSPDCFVREIAYFLLYTTIELAESA